MTQNASRARYLLPFIYAVAIGGLLWARNSVGCPACRQAQSLVGDLDLTLIGLVCYTALLALLVRVVVRSPGAGSEPTMRWYHTALPLAAAGAHLPLLWILYRSSVHCPPCILTAAAALTGAVVVIAMQPKALRQAFLLIPLAAIATFWAVKGSQRIAAVNLIATTEAAERQLMTERPSPRPGRAWMVLYVRDGCQHCEHFRSEVLPALKGEFGSSIEVEERDAWPRMVSPTVIILGAHNSRFIGSKPLSQIRAAVVRARGSRLNAFRQAPRTPVTAQP